jgi:DHA3 family tetracycline resistance protein-like MFS transporter
MRRQCRYIRCLDLSTALRSVKRLSRIGIFRPLTIRDFALLWTGMTVSLVGDGIYTVAIAWQVYDLSNAPTALAVVGAAWMVPQVLLLLLGGAVSDRVDRRQVLMLSDAIRGAAIAAIGVLAVTDTLELWHLIALVAVYGAGGALFTPAFTALVPQIVPRRLLLQANSLDQFVRPLTGRLVGPALGGWLIAVFGAGTAFLVDAGSFAASAAAILLMRTRPVLAKTGPRPSIVGDVRAGLGFVRSQTWLWATLLAVTIAMLFFLGPVYVLMPYIVKNTLGAGADGLGLVFAAGGAGAILTSLVLGQRRMPRRPLTVIYIAWSLSAFSLIGYAVATELWHAMLVSFVSVAALTAGGVLWSTVLQRLVPEGMLGRVASIDWLVSFGLAPLSYALTGPIADTIGAHDTLVQAGAISGCVLLGFLLLVPGIRRAERREPHLDTALGLD